MLFIPYALALGIGYITSLVVYRLCFHPLARIPGPPLARVTYLFEWYYDLVLSGNFRYQLKSLHERYGPIIRINPDQVHVNDPQCYDEIYNQTNGRNVKPQNYAEVFGPYPATIGTQSHELHRIRRSAVNQFFSKKSVIDLLPVMLRPIHILRGRLREASKTGQTLNMKYMYSAVTLDIINDYCFAREPFYIHKPDFGRKCFDDVDSFLTVSILNIHMPWLMRLTYSLPDRVNKILAPAMADILDFRRDLSRQVEAIRLGEDKSYEQADHRTVFHELLESDLPPLELERDRVRDEAFQLVTAGSGTTATVLRNTAYHIAANESVRQRLHAELVSAIPDPNNLPSLIALEQLPYLAAVINEGLRLCAPVIHRMTRQYPDKTFNIHGYTLPPNTKISVTLPLILENEDIFPEPYTFRPERWLDQNQDPENRLEKYLVTFNRGPRMCLGINLARAELVLILAAVFREFTFDVSEVVRERDINYSHDFIVGAPRRDSPGILVKLKAV
ncbi:cytochrome P450 [Aspergillus mulundensis]|uniref:Putative benzoate 4-monooxygenase cytochrome P450 n=1 Tax=Aspergillus mulundensis TaxID=1810919 RepID=A0A3D8T5I9_9EURO|nr:putative benzoate 4-monooxygenase cytochrome P450 [Aspergillus mulundensis]RDW93800.1 putative benzoate 4-monooxygenase cytochrome P450 [Aspergillus mulundensis]